MSMRVISGTARGRRLKRVPGDSTRPIMDRVKEALFNMIGSDIIDASFLDLFGGTGSVGIEALSRGAARAVFVERNKKAVRTIIENLEATDLNSRAFIRHIDAFEFLKQSPAFTYDFIFVAPPQYKGLWQKTIETLDSDPSWLHESLRIIVQIDPSENHSIVLQNLVEQDQRRYGNTLLLFYNQKVIN